MSSSDSSFSVEVVSKSCSGRLFPLDWELTYPPPWGPPQQPQRQRHRRRHHQQREQHHQRRQTGRRRAWKNPQRSAVVNVRLATKPMTTCTPADKLRRGVVVIPYLVDVLAVKLREELLEALIVGLNANGGQDALDVLGRGGAVASEPEEEVSCEVLHFERCAATITWLVS